MVRRFYWLFRSYVRVAVLGCATVMLAVLLSARLAPAHEGHDHAAETSSTVAPASPRIVASSENYHLVGIVEGEVLVIYLDRAEDNAPVTTATLEGSLDGEPFKAELDEKAGTYEVTSSLLRKAGSHEVLVSLTEGSTQDLLVGTLTIPRVDARAEQTPRAAWRAARDAWTGWLGHRAPLSVAGLLLLAAACGALLFGARRLVLIIPAMILGLVLATAFAWAHEGHDHGQDLTASTGNSPTRRPDGSIFLPKPTQRLLEIRTRTAKVENVPKTVSLNGRVVANPNRSGVVQSTLQGRYEPPEGGVPPLGTVVKKGDLLGRVAPAFQSIDTSDMAQTLGTLDQEIALNRRKLARQEELLEKAVVARATVEDIRIQLEGLEKRRRELLAAKVRSEDLRAAVDGVIAAARVVAGQVVAQSDQLFQIIDPTSLLVEALVFDQVNPDAVKEATASVSGDAVIKLKFMGRSRALQQQYSILQFQITDAQVPLNVGAPVTVTVSTAGRLTGIVLPRSALAQAPNGQTVVFSHREPEIFVPRAVRVEPFDSENVLVVSGIAAGEKIVVRNAPLLNQVR